LHLGAQIGRTGEEWFVRPAENIPTCIIFGEVEDERGKQWMGPAFAEAEHATILTLPNCGHNVVRLLNKKDLLADVLLCSVTPAAMVSKIKHLLEAVVPSARDLQRYVLALSEKKAFDLLPYLNGRLAEEGLPPVGEGQLGRSRRAKRSDGDRESDARAKGERRQPGGASRISDPRHPASGERNGSYGGRPDSRGGVRIVYAHSRRAQVIAARRAQQEEELGRLADAS
jgi:hypothetical protein